MGNEIGKLIGNPNHEVKKHMILGGIGLIGIGVPFSLQSGKHKQQAIDTYNAGVPY